MTVYKVFQPFITKRKKITGLVRIFRETKTLKNMTIYTLTIGNIYNEETEIVESNSSIDDCYDQAVEVAEEMFNNLKKEYEGNELYDFDERCIEDDITYTEGGYDTSDFFDEEYYRCR